MGKRRTGSEEIDKRFKGVEEAQRALNRQRVPLIIGAIVSIVILLSIVMLMQSDDDNAEIVCIERLGGLLKSYHRLAA